MREFVVAGLLMSPFVRYALVAGVFFVPLHLLLVALRFHKWFWHPLLAEIALYICLISLLNQLA